MGALTGNSTQLNSGFPVYKIANANFLNLFYAAKVTQAYVTYIKLQDEPKTKATS